jgi:hypothetical protein
MQIFLTTNATQAASVSSRAGTGENDEQQERIDAGRYPCLHSSSSRSRMRRRHNRRSNETLPLRPSTCLKSLKPAMLGVDWPRESSLYRNVALKKSAAARLRWKGVAPPPRQRVAQKLYEADELVKLPVTNEPGLLVIRESRFSARTATRFLTPGTSRLRNGSNQSACKK